MKKFAVFSGFLGAGKTTTMMALTKYCQQQQIGAAMISNDLGHGVNLADNRYAQLSGCNASEMTDECICYQNENLADRLNSYYDNGCRLVISDIPGFGVGALEHVYHGLTEKFPGQFELSPFTVLVEPDTISILRDGTGGDLEYLYDTQLVEADIIVLNKCDLIDAQKQQEDAAWLTEHYPNAKVLPVSALKGEGLEALCQALLEGKASMRRPDIGYGGEAFQAAMGKISEYYIQYRAEVCCGEFDGNSYLADMARQVREGIESAGYAIPHLKLLAWTPEGDFGKADLIGAQRPIEVNHSFQRPCTSLSVILNASAVCPRQTLDELITGSVNAVSDKYGLSINVEKSECFGMMG
ncbi:MAG: hypothetical protein IJ072_06795 [Oscillospiraceae bacterium]|nr:hypothetical protein [Oscillospiraceae bacterium]